VGRRAETWGWTLPALGAGLFAVAILAALLGAELWPAVVAGVAGLGVLLLGLANQRILTHLHGEVETARSESALAEERLAQQRTAVDSFSNGLDVAIFLCDERGLVLYANRKAIEMFRFEDPVGRAILAVSLSHDLEKLVGSILEEPIDGELAFSYPEERIARVRAWREGGGSERIFVSIVDITELRRLERVRQDFVANVSHEVRTPMTTIRAMAETLQDDDTDDPELRQRYLERIITEVDRLTLISQDLLILSAAESGVLRKNTCDLVPIARNALALVDEAARTKGLNLVLEAPDSLFAEANGAQIGQVFVNLIENAVKYTAEGTVTMRLRSEGPNAIIVVEDTGIGIPSEHLPRIFERFYRVDKARTRPGGTGLGLSIVRHIIESHGGTVSVESALNRGSVFSLSLPLGEAGPPPGPSA